MVDNDEENPRVEILDNNDNDDNDSIYEDVPDKLPINFLIKFIKPFDGNREELSSYIADCNRGFELATAAQKSTLLDYTLTQITGKAKAACVNRSFSEWIELKDYLKTMYQDTKHKAQLLCELTTLKQKNEETLSAFTTRLETCLKRTINSITQTHEKGISVTSQETQKFVLNGKLEMLQDIALNRYTYFTIVPISNALRIREIKTLNEAIAVAKAEQQIQRMVTNQSSNPKAHYSKSSKPNSQFKDTKPNDQSKSKLCNYCKKPGHTIDDCRKRAYNNSKSTQIAESSKSSNHFPVFSTSATQAAKSSTKTCNYCKKPGHLIKDCFARANANKRNDPKNSNSKNLNVRPVGAENKESWD